MDNFIANLFIGIISGIIGGIISAFIIYYYSERRIKARKIIEYAELTAEKAFFILEEARQCSEGKDIKLLKKLINKEVRRNFPGRIVDRSKTSKELQEAIAACNTEINKIDKAIQAEDKRSALLNAIGDLNNSLLNIWNATTQFNVTEDKRIEKDKKLFIRITVGVFIIVFIGLIKLA